MPKNVPVKRPKALAYREIRAHVVSCVGEPTLHGMRRQSCSVRGFVPADGHARGSPSDASGRFPGIAVIGHRVEVSSGAEPFVTLAVLWPTPCRAVIVGVNPAPKSVEAGHYYQGSDGRRAITRLRAAGLLPKDRGGFADDEAVAAGIGFTDLVKRPTGRASDLSRVELEAGRATLRANLDAHEVGLVVCVFKPAVVALLGRAEPPGFQSRELGTSRVFRMPSPYERADAADAAMRELAAHLAR